MLGFILSPVSFSLWKEKFSELRFKDLSHVLQQRTKRAEQESETTGRRGKKSGKTFPVWTGTETSFQFLLHYWKPWCMDPSSILFLKVGSATGYIPSWWILNSSRLRLYVVSTWSLPAVSLIWICCSHQCSSTGGNSSIDSTRLRYLILQGCDRVVKNNELKCAYIRALVIPCVLLVLPHCWGITDMNFLCKPWLPFPIQAGWFFKCSFTFLICLQMSTKVS